MVINLNGEEDFRKNRAEKEEASFQSPCGHAEVGHLTAVMEHYPW